jgi:hypothetical protein
MNLFLFFWQYDAHAIFLFQNSFASSLLSSDTLDSYLKSASLAWFTLVTCFFFILKPLKMTKRAVKFSTTPSSKKLKTKTQETQDVFTIDFSEIQASQDPKVSDFQFHSSPQTSQNSSSQSSSSQNSSSQDSSKITKTLEKILNQNTKILSKLETLLSSHKSLEKRMSKLEQASETTINEELIKSVVSEAARELIKKSIYPSQDELNNEAERVISENHAELYKKI